MLALQKKTGGNGPDRTCRVGIVCCRPVVLRGELDSTWKNIYVAWSLIVDDLKFVEVGSRMQRARRVWDKMRF